MVDDWDADGYAAAYGAELEAGRAWLPAPEPWELEGPGGTLAVPDTTGVDLAELAELIGPDGMAAAVFDQDHAGDTMRPGPALASLTEQGIGQLDRLTPGQLLGMASATRRLAARAEYLHLRAVAEFGRRWEAKGRARKAPPGRSPGEFAAEELGMELAASPRAAGDLLDLAAELDTRLPATRAALAAGVIDGGRAKIIGRYTGYLSDADAAAADEILAAAAPGLRYDQLARRALGVAIRLDPEAMKRGKDEARKTRRRVQAWREESGNAALAGRELAIEDALGGVKSSV